MRILLRDSNSNKWRLVENVQTKTESELQKMLIESPSLVTIDEIRDGVSPLVYSINEFGLPGSGSTDVISFTSQGDIAIIECKLASNQEIKRKVIGQILEYAAYLWRMGYEELDRRIQLSKGKSLANLVAESVEADWDEELFREGVKQNLENGSFILVIVVDEINEELRRIINYLNECSESAFSLHALEMNRFRSDKIEVMIPQIYGNSNKQPIRRRGQWTKDEFFVDLESKNKPEILSLVKEIYDWSSEKADRVWLGTGKKDGSFTYHVLRNGKTISIFTIYSNGKMSINYGWMVKAAPAETLEMFHSMIHKIGAFEHLKAEFEGKFPLINLAALKTDSDVAAFKEAVVWLQGKV